MILGPILVLVPETHSRLYPRCKCWQWTALRFPNGTPSPCLYRQPFTNRVPRAPRRWLLSGTRCSTTQHSSSPLHTCKAGCSELWSPSSGPVLYTQSHKHWIEGNNHLPHPAGYTLANTTQHVIGLLRCEDKELTDIQFVNKQGSQVISCRDTVHLVCPYPVVTAWVNSMSGTGPHACLPFPSLIWVRSYSPSVSRLRHIGKCDRNPEFPGERSRGDSLLSQLCNQEFLSHNMTIILINK